MNEHLLVGLTLVLVLGVCAQWIAWRLRIPAIILLLLFGFLAGPVSGAVRPDALFGDVLFPLVSSAVAIILFEGGLSLRMSEFRAVGSIVRNLVGVGLLTTWGLTALATHYLVGLPVGLSVLFGAIMTVTGPTVTLPLLRQVRPRGQVGSILKWEGILNDPVGAMLAVLVFEQLIAAGSQSMAASGLTGILLTIIAGVATGFAGARAIVHIMRRHWAPEYLQNAITLMTVLSVFAISNHIQPESGLLAVTMMGIFLANQEHVTVKHIVVFKENLQVLLLSFLFIMLAGRVQLSDLAAITPASLLLLACMILVIRPAAVLVSTWRHDVSWRERAFLAWMAPRGIVAAAVSSIFAIELVKYGFPEAADLVPLTFLVIVGTIITYGSTASLLARWLNLSSSDPQGCLIIGAHPIARAVARALRQEQVAVVLVDTNDANITAARADCLATFYGSVLSESFLDDVNLDGLGNMLALTPNAEVNSLAALYLAPVLGNEHVYQLCHEESSSDAMADELTGTILFGEGITHTCLAEKFARGCRIESSRLESEEDQESFQLAVEQGRFLPLFLVSNAGKVVICVDPRKVRPKAEQRVVYLDCSVAPLPVETIVEEAEPVV